MIGPHVTTQYLDVLAPAYFSYRIADSLSDITTESRLAVLRDEHEMVMQIVDRVPWPSVVDHAAIVPQTP